MNIVLIGPPGTGKGTIAELIEEEFGFKHISAGDLLREEVKNQTEIGKQAEPIMKSGALVDNELVAQVVSSNVSKHLETGFILDGFPRNLSQAQILEKLFEKINVKIDLVLLIETNYENIVKRLSARRQCPKCNKIYGTSLPPKKEGICNEDQSSLILREDDKPGVIQKRLDIYRENSKGLIDLFEQKKLIERIEGNKKPLEVFLEVKEKILEKKK